MVYNFSGDGNIGSSGDNNEIKEFKKNVFKFVKFGFVIVLFIILFCSFLGSFSLIPAGHRGTVLTLGAVENRIMNEGLNFKIPFVQSVTKTNVQVAKSETKTTAASKDLQQAHSTIVLNYHVDPKYVNIVYKEIGINYENVIIDPAVHEILKATTAKYTAVDLIQKRETVSSEIKTELRKRLAVYHMIIDDFSMTNFTFSPEFSKAIEEKQTAEQKAIKAKNDLERIKVEAQQKIETAKAEAESLRVQKMNVNDELIRLRQVEASIKAIEKWDGHMPIYSGGAAMPFIDVSNLSTKHDSKK